LQQKSVLIRGVVALEGDSLLSLYFTISLHQKSVLIRGVVCLEGDSLLSLYFTISLHQKSVLIRGVVSLERGRGYFEIVKYNDNKLSPPQGKPPLLSGHISDVMK
jgi:hypothetical protein